MVTITLQNLQNIFPNTAVTTLTNYVEPFNTILPTYEINTNARVAMFLAQAGYESDYLQFTEGNFNFSADGLVRVFPKYFANTDVATPYAHQPEKIVNYVYAGRMGNNPAPSTDAWLYRERGLIQLCGKDNYISYSNYKHMSINDTITYLGTPEGVVDVAAWFFQTRKLNAIADTGDVSAATKVVNGGQIGLVGRTALYNLAIKEFPI